MNIADLKPNEKVLELVARVARLDEVREVKPGLRVQDGIVEDDTGQVLCAFWQDQIGTIRVGDTIAWERSWCKAITHPDHPRRGDLQLMTGPYGKVRLVPPEIS